MAFISFVTEVRHSGYTIGSGNHTDTESGSLVTYPYLTDLPAGVVWPIATARSPDTGYASNRVLVRVGGTSQITWRHGTTNIAIGAIHAVVWKVGPIV